MKKKQLKKEVRKLNANSALLFDTAMERINAQAAKINDIELELQQFRALEMKVASMDGVLLELYDLRMTGNPIDCGGTLLTESGYSEFCTPIVHSNGKKYSNNGALKSENKSKANEYPTGTNAELRNTVARLQNRLKQMSVFNPSDNSFIVQQVADNTSRYKQLLDQAANDNQQLRNCIEELERKLAVPPADVTGYEDAFIDGFNFAKVLIPSEQRTDEQLRIAYHDKAVQRAVFPDTINGE